MEKFNRKELEKEMLFDAKNRWYVGRVNLLDLVKPPRMPQRVTIKDETLREGEETPGVYLTLEKKLRIARALEEIGVKEMEVGYAGSIREHFEFARALKTEGIKLRLCSHARAYSKEDEWKKEVDEVAKSGVEMISFVGYVSECRIDGKSWLNKREFPKRIYDVITYSKQYGLRVGFGLADPARSQLQYIVECCVAAGEAGVDRYYVYDGPGCATPEAIRFLTLLARDTTKSQVAVHCHDDYGLATANTLEAVKAGGEVVDCVVNGLGDRAGNAALEEVVAALTVLYQIDTGIKIEGLYRLSKLVEELYQVPIAPNKALVGINQYNHATDSHIQDIIRGEWFTWENIRAEALGQKRILEFGATALSRQPSGAIGSKMEVMGYRFDQNDLDQVTEKIKGMIEKKGFVSEDQLEEVIHTVMRGQ